jgi:hypothetical protein
MPQPVDDRRLSKGKATDDQRKELVYESEAVKNNDYHTAGHHQWKLEYGAFTFATQDRPEKRDRFSSAALTKNHSNSDNRRPSSARRHM